MIKQLLISGDDFHGVKYAPKHKLYFIMRKDSVDVYLSSSHEKLCELPCEAITSICFNEDESRIYCMEFCGKISMFDMDGIMNGNTDPLSITEIDEGILEMLEQVHWLKDDIVLLIYLYKIYIVDAGRGISEIILDGDENSYGLDVTISYFDDKKRMLSIISSKDPDGHIELKGKEIDIIIPADVIHVDKKSSNTIYAGDYRIIMEKTGMFHGNKPVKYTLIGPDFKGEGVFTDKKERKALDQIFIDHIASNDYGMIIMNATGYIVVIDTTFGRPDIKFIDNEFGKFDIIEGRDILICIEKEGLAVLSI